MSETKTVRDFSEPCKHGYRIWHVIKDTDTTDGGNIAYPRMCPGGAELILSKVTAEGASGLEAWIIRHEPRDVRETE